MGSSGLRRVYVLGLIYMAKARLRDGGPEGYTWQLVDITIDGEPQPDGEVIRFKRPTARNEKSEEASRSKNFCTFGWVTFPVPLPAWITRSRIQAG